MSKATLAAASVVVGSRFTMGYKAKLDQCSNVVNVDAPPVNLQSEPAVPCVATPLTAGTVSEDEAVEPDFKD